MPSPSSGLVELKLDYAGTSDHAVGHAVCPWEVSGGEHTWEIICYPRGLTQEDNGEYLSLYLDLTSSDRYVRFIFNAFLVETDGSQYSPGFPITHLHPSPDGFRSSGWEQFARRSDLESRCVVDGVLKIICTITVLNDDDNLAGVPSSDIGNHLGQHLDRAEGTDVSFVIGGETFHAHWTVLAARSPVFRAQLLADGTMSRITLRDIEPATFRILLRFVYTDVLPADEELLTGPSSTTTELIQSLIAASDKYDLPRLKLMCSRKLGDTVSVETVAALFGFADTNNCSDLTNRCLDFLMAGDNFKKVAVTDEYFELRQRFPSVIEKIGKRSWRPSSPILKKMRMW